MGQKSIISQLAKQRNARKTFEDVDIMGGDFFLEQNIVDFEITISH